MYVSFFKTTSLLRYRKKHVSRYFFSKVIWGGVRYRLPEKEEKGVPRGAFLVAELGGNRRRARFTGPRVLFLPALGMRAKSLMKRIFCTNIAKSWL